MQYINSKVHRPNKELKGFAKVYLDPNETKRVEILLDNDAFKFFNPDTFKWEVEELDYELLVGASSQDIKLSESIFIEGIKINPSISLSEIPSYKSGNIQDVSVEEFTKILGREVPNPRYNFYKKNRIIVDYNTTVEQLRYSKRWIGRFFSRAVRFSVKFFKFIGKRETANLLAMGVVHLPMRGLSRMSNGAINWGQLDGLIMMFNGKFFKGLSKFFKEKRK